MDGAVLTRRRPAIKVRVKVYIGWTGATRGASHWIFNELLPLADHGWGNVRTECDYIVPNTFRVPDPPPLTSKPRLLIVPTQLDGSVEVSEWQPFFNQFPTLRTLFYLDPAATDCLPQRQYAIVCRGMEELMSDLGTILNQVARSFVS